jgi:hypothetical protein
VCVCKRIESRKNNYEIKQKKIIISSHDSHIHKYIHVYKYV